MGTKTAWLVAACLLPLPLAAQTPAVVPMDQEPHHHLVLQNDYVKVFNVEVSPGDSIVLHRHDRDTFAIAIGDQLVTVGIPGKPEIHQKNADAQVRLLRSGYMHSTKVDGDTPYHTVAVELLRPQTNFHLDCAEILPSLQLNCQGSITIGSPSLTSQQLFASSETHVRLVHVLSGRGIGIGDLKDSHLIVALDPATLSPDSPSGPDQTLHAGDFVWIVKGVASGAFTNNGKGEARFIEFSFKPIDPADK